MPGDQRFDAVVVGGGVYGLLLALEGAVRGQKLLLVERGDFGSGASFNHLRTIHGGLRYLRSLDFHRARLSNAQRLWWLEHFPDLVEPIRCLMPLYGRGLRRPAAFRLAFGLGRMLGLHRGAGGTRGPFEVISAAAVRERLPACVAQGLRGGAVWQDAFMARPHRLVMELGHWAEAAGATLANYTDLTAARRLPDGAWRLSLRTGRTGETGEVTASRIVNAAGASVDDVIGQIAGRRLPAVLVPTLGWNLLLDRPPPSSYSVAVMPPGRGHTTWFLHPYGARTLAGTGHAAIRAGAPGPRGPSPAQLEGSLRVLNEALPGCRFSRDEIRHVFHGVIPGVAAGSAALRKRHAIVDHARDGMPGLWTVLGVKFTEAPHVARWFWDARLGPRRGPLPRQPQPLAVPTVDAARGMTDERLRKELLRIAASEWQADAGDLVWRRTDFWLDDSQARRVAALVGPAISGNCEPRNVPPAGID